MADETKKTPETTIALDTAVPQKKLLKGDVVDIKGLDAGDIIQNTENIYGLPKFSMVINKSNDRIICMFEQYGTFSTRTFLFDATKGQVKRLTGMKSKELKEKFENYQMNTSIKTECNTPLSRYIGADPEFFVENEFGDIIPAFIFLPSKKHPLKEANNSGNTAANTAYWDGFQAEFTTPAETCLAWQVDHLRHGLKMILDAAKKKDASARLSTRTLIELPKDVLANTAPEHIEFGCSPSLNIYGLKSNLDAGGRAIPFRSSGGHIHFGFGKQSESSVQKIVKGLDAILGVCSVSMFAEFDNPIRRNYYGLPGEYRLPPHGLEYRVLSNAWLFHPVLAHLTVDLARQVTNFSLSNLFKLWKGEEQETIDVIALGDVKKAREIMERNSSLLKSIISSIYASGSAQTAYDLMLNGISSGIAEPSNLVKNWHLAKNANWENHSSSPNCQWNMAWVNIKAGRKI